MFTQMLGKITQGEGGSESALQQVPEDRNRIKQYIVYTLGSSCDSEKTTLHAVYMTVILLLLISNLVLIYFLWRMRSRSGDQILLMKLGSN